jgi:hypothetical protein
MAARQSRAFQTTGRRHRHVPSPGGQAMSQSPLTRLARPPNSRPPARTLPHARSPPPVRVGDGRDLGPSPRAQGPRQRPLDRSAGEPLAERAGPEGGPACIAGRLPFPGMAPLRLLAAAPPTWAVRTTAKPPEPQRPITRATGRSGEQPATASPAAQRHSPTPGSGVKW